MTISNEEQIRLENKKLKEEKSENEILKIKLEKIQDDLVKVSKRLEQNKNMNKK